MKLTKLMTTALCALSVAVCMVPSTFAQDGGGSVGDQQVSQDAKQKVTEAADRYKASTAADKDSVALTEFVDLVAKYPQSQEANSWTGYLYLRTGEPAKAIDFLKKARELRPDDLEVLNNLGNAYVKTNQKQLALLVFEELKDKDKTKYQPHYNIGNIHLENKDYERAVQAFSKANELQPERPQILNNLGVAYKSLKQWENAAGSFVKASDISPKDATYARNAGSVLYQQQRYASAVTYFERALKNGAKERELIMALGDSYTQLKKTAEYNKLMTQYADILSDDPNYYYNLGVTRKMNGDVAGAEAAFRKAYQLRDTDKDTLSNLGVILFNKGEYEEARLMFEKLAGLDPSPKNKRNFAAAASRAGDIKAALPIWNELIKSNPSDHEVRLLIADARYELGDLKEAMALYKQVAAAKPKSALALDGVGRCHIADANYAAAEAALRAAIAADSKFVPAYNNLAVTLEKMNKRKDAIALLEKALTLEPENSDVLKNLKRMKSAG